VKPRDTKTSIRIKPYDLGVDTDGYRDLWPHLSSVARSNQAGIFIPPASVTRCTGLFGKIHLT
jgi:hypothetical protein